MKKFIFYFFLFFSFLFFRLSVAQPSEQIYFNELQSQDCGTEAASGNSFPFFPVEHDTMKILVVFARYPDDTWDPSPPNQATQYWPNSLGTNKPTWADQVIRPNTISIGTTNITAFFRDASFNKFFVIGDVYRHLYIFENNSTYYSFTNGRHVGYAVKELLTNIKDSVDYTLYDKFAPNDPTNKRHPDGQVDFILIVFRFFLSSETGTGSGVAALGGTAGNFGTGITQITLDGVNITSESCFGNGSGAISTQRTPWNYNVSCHEIGHYLLGGHRNAMGLFNLLNTNGNSFPSADEREFLGWSHASDSVTSNTTITLEDYATTGDFMKIIRGGVLYYFEYRRRINYHFTPAWTVFYNWTFNQPTSLVPDSSLLIHRYADAESADGRWNFLKGSVYTSRYVVDTINRGNFQDRFFFNTPNRLLGEDIYDMRKDSCVNFTTGAPIHTKRNAKSAGGDTNSCFDIGYNQVYSPWSNPQAPVSSSSDSFAVEILGKTTEGNLILGVYFSNLPQTTPSKPQYLKISKNYVSTGRFYPKLTWLSNKEPDMSTYGIYKATITTPGEDATEYSWIGSTSDTTYIDQTILMYDPQVHYQGGCPPQPVNYTYRVTAVDLTDKESVMSERDSIAGYIDPCVVMDEGDNLQIENPSIKNELLQNSPNPFNPSTSIHFSIENPSFVTLKVYDNLGREIVTLINENRDPGIYFIKFDGSNLSTGIYYYKLIAGEYSQIRKMLLLK